MTQLTVKELTTLLEKCPPDHKVFMEGVESPDDIFSVGNVVIQLYAPPEENCVVISR